MNGRAPFPDEIAVGRPLPWPVHDRSGMLLLKKGGVVHSEAMLAVLLQRGVIQQRDLGLPGASRSRESAGPGAASSADSGSVFRQLRGLRLPLQSALARLSQPGGERALPQCLELAADVRRLCAGDLDAALAAFQVDASEDVGDLAANALHGAVICELLGQALGMDAKAREPLICAVLTHDIGMLSIADGLMRQKIELSVEQRAAMQRHTEVGCDLLRRAGVESESWLRAVAEHHERLDGSGYPRGLVGDAISREARMVAVVDIYSAMLRPRAYREAVHSREALRAIFLERGSQVDESLAALFIHQIGVHPPGTLVRLGNGEVAMVTRRGASSTQPQMRAVIGADGNPLVRPPLRETSDPACRIVGSERVSRYRSVLGRVHHLWDDDALPPSAQSG